jgi:hypothetical protein
MWVPKYTLLTEILSFLSTVKEKDCIKGQKKNYMKEYQKGSNFSFKKKEKKKGMPD